MLFRLQMSIDAAIDAYMKLAEHVFSEKKWFFQEGTFKATRLEEAMLSIIQQSGIDDPQQVPLFDKDGPKWYLFITSPFVGPALTSNSFVTAVDPFDQIRFPKCLCSWGCDSFCTVVDAVRATTAVLTFFKPARVRHVRYLDVNLRCGNPAKCVVQKARELYDDDRPISCLLSLGTGTKCPFRLHPRTDRFQKFFSTRLCQALRDVDKNCAQQEMDMVDEFFRHSSPTLYVRLNDNDTHSPLADWRSFNYLQDHTRHYLATASPCQPWCSDQLLQMLKGTNGNNILFHHPTTRI